MKRIAHIIFLISASLLGLAGCGKTETNFETGLAQQILHIANGEEPRELDPQLSTGSPESNIHLAIYEGLTQKDPKSLEILPGVAESWTRSDDGLVYTFKIRANARWSNGDALTAHDFVWSWHRALMPTLASEWAYMKYFIKNAEAFHKGELSGFDKVGVKALDDYTLEVSLESPTEFFLQLVNHPSYFPVHKGTILKHAAMDQPVSPWTRPENWVGNGPFTLQSWELNKQITTAKNPEYWDSKNVKLNGVVFYPITDQQAEVRAFRSGQIHLTYTPQMAIEKVQHYKDNEPESLRITPTYASYFYEINVTREHFKDKRVRQALAYAIDRKTLVERVTRAGEREAYSLMPNDPEGYSPSGLFEYNPEKARQLLADAGYPNGEGFPAIEILYNTQDNHRVVALAIQQMLKENLSITVQLQNQEWKVYLNTKKEQQHDIARAGWIADYLDPSNFLEILLSTAGNNDTGWGNAEYDAILAELKRTSDKQARYALFEQANQILVDEMPVIPIYLYADLNLVSPVVKGWYDNVMHYHPYNRVYLEANN